MGYIYKSERVAEKIALSQSTSCIAVQKNSSGLGINRKFQLLLIYKEIP